MSSLIVEVCTVEEVKPHPNADQLQLVRVKGWWTVTGIGDFKTGDQCVYIPPDSVLTEEWANQWGISKFCAPLTRNPDGTRPPGFRVRACRLRGECSFGTIQRLSEDWPIGTDVKDYYGITKWEPPIKALDGDAAPPVAAFHNYTDIENLQNFPNIFKEGEEVVVDEKIHGSNCRVGLIRHPDPETGEMIWQYMAGSHSVRRKELDQKGNTSRYWLPLQSNALKSLLEFLLTNHNDNIVVFGEIYGPGVQDMHYGRNEIGFRVFDISVGGKFLDYNLKSKALDFFEIETVPFVYRGPFSLDKMNELVDGPTLICSADKIKEPFKGREGIVIRPVKERFDANLGGDGRVILKYISVDYHERKNKNQSEDH